MAHNFKNAKEMYDYICNGNDIYSASQRIYAFVYNDAGAICIYYLSDEDVVELVEKNKKHPDEYWGAFLGWKGSSILDDGKYNSDEYRYSENWEKNKLYLRPSLEFCEEMFGIEDWIDTKDVIIKKENEK